MTVIDADKSTGNGYTYVEDVSNLIVKACDVPITETRIFNTMEGNYTNRQVVEAIRKINPQARVIIEEGVESEMYKNFQPPLLDTDSTRTEFGWQPKYGLEQGLRKVMNYFRHQERLPLL